MPELSRAEIGARFGDVLERLGLTQADLARITGRSRSAINGWISGRGQPPLEVLAKLCREQGIDPGFLLGLDEVATPSEVVTLDDTEWATLPVLLEQVGAGEPVLDVAEEPRVHAFRRDWLRRTYGTDDPRQVWLFQVARDHKGESMAPTILPGSTCLVGPLLTTVEHQLAVEAEGIHLLFLSSEMELPNWLGQEGFLVKRIRLVPEGLFVYGDNPSPEHRPFLLHVDGDIRKVVKGRIKWVGREV